MTNDAGRSDQAPAQNTGAVHAARMRPMVELWNLLGEAVEALPAASPGFRSCKTTRPYFGFASINLVTLPVRPWPVAIVTLKNRTLSPIVERFIESAR
jgi:hypothetical protein